MMMMAHKIYFEAPNKSIFVKSPSRTVVLLFPSSGYETHWKQVKHWVIISNSVAHLVFNIAWTDSFYNNYFPNLTTNQSSNRLLCITYPPSMQHYTSLPNMWYILVEVEDPFLGNTSPSCSLRHLMLLSHKCSSLQASYPQKHSRSHKLQCRGPAWSRTNRKLSMFGSPNGPISNGSTKVQKLKRVFLYHFFVGPCCMLLFQGLNKIFGIKKRHVRHPWDRGSENQNNLTELSFNRLLIRCIYYWKIYLTIHVNKIQAGL